MKLEEVKSAIAVDPPPPAPPADMLHDRVLLRRLAPAQRSAGGLHLVTQGKSTEGIVVAVGPGNFDPEMPRMREPMSVKVGDHVLFGQYAGFEWSYLGDAYVVCRDGDLCLVLHGTGE